MIVTRHIRLESPDSRHPLNPPSYRPALLVTGCLLMAAFGAFVAAAANVPGFRAVMAGLALFLVVLALTGKVWTESIALDTVRVTAAGGGTRFIGTPLARSWFTVLAVAVLVPAATAILFELQGLPVHEGSALRWGRWGLYALGLASLLWLVRELWGVRTPAGLTLSAEGVTGVRGDRAISLRWEELTAASVVTSRRAKLLLVDIRGRVCRLEPRYFGSDPHVVAAVIEHYRANPDDRALLADPEGALRRFAHSQEQVSPPEPPPAE